MGYGSRGRRRCTFVERVDVMRGKEKDERGARRKDQQPAVRSSPWYPPAEPMRYTNNGKSIHPPHCHRPLARQLSFELFEIFRYFPEIKINFKKADSEPEDIFIIN